jgi:hypothetical protein
MNKKQPFFLLRRTTTQTTTWEINRLQFRPRWWQTTWFQFWTGRVWVIVDLVVLLDLVIFLWEFEKD